MALNKLIPEIWSARLLETLRNDLVYSALTNRDYEGEIANVGDRVKINSIGKVTVKTFTKNTDLDDPETLTDAQQELIISEGDYFNFQIDDLDTKQQKPKVMSQAMSDAAYELRKAQDTFTANLHTEIATANFVGTDASPQVPTVTTAYDLLVDLSVKLDESDTPDGNRFVVIPPWFHGMLRKDDRFTDKSRAGLDVLANGLIGEAAGFTVHKSNQVPNTSSTLYKIIAGHRMAWSSAENLAKLESYRMEKRFADAVKGLHAYGAKVTRPSNLALLTANSA